MNAITKFCAGAVAALAAATALPANASTFLISFIDTGANTDLTATITTGATNGVFGEDVTAITGNLVGPNFTNEAINLLTPNPSSPLSQVSADGLFIYDNNYDPSNTNGLVSVPGILFDTVGGVEYNLFANGNGSYTLYSAVPTDSGYQYSTFEIGYIAVPEPVTWAMMALGIGLLGAGLRLGRAKPEFAAA